MEGYKSFLQEKQLSVVQSGFEVDFDDINPAMFEWQKVLVRWAIFKGRAAIFADCGLGKTLMQLEWSKHVFDRENKPILIFAPLAVSAQTKREGEKFGIDVNIAESRNDVVNGINITNYEKIHKFNLSEFIGVVIDESSILKSYSGKFRTEIIESTRNIPYKLACTATPAPNDHMELGNHAEFLNIMKRTEMLSMFFTHDSGETQKWRLKGHAEKDFWRWVASWAVMLKTPADIGFDDGDFILPDLRFHEHIVDCVEATDALFVTQATSLKEQLKVRRDTIGDRAEYTSQIVNNSEQSWVVWCNLNDESKQLSQKIDGAVEIAGSHDNKHKEKNMIGFANGEFDRLVTKPKLAGFGMNWQHCHNVAFVGLNHSYEQFYQAVRRCWRFGQKSPVDVHVIISNAEGSVLENIKRKEADAEKMSQEMIKNMKDLSIIELETVSNKTRNVDVSHVVGNGYELFHGDCVDAIRKIESEVINYTIFSPPFADLYTYSDLPQDMGNSRNYDEFFRHFDFLVSELFRVTAKGRLVSFHCIDIPMMKERDGAIGLKDFPGDLIRLFQKHGWIYHSKHTIWKDPLVEATRTKALGLLHKQIVKDSSMCRAGLPDYLITMRKPGENKTPIAHTGGFGEYIGEDQYRPQEQGIKFSHITWQRYASPVWFDIRQTNTLNARSARTDKDEKHICPLQLDVIERALELWSIEGDLVLSPFMGIGSEGYMSLKKNRKFIGIELKKSYFDEAVKNLESVANNQQMELFG